jgi:hypothetical protein
VSRAAPTPTRASRPGPKGIKRFGVVSLLLEIEMNTRASHNGYLVYWVAAVLLVIGVGLGDATIVAWSASIITFWQLVAVTSSFGLIAMGILITFCQMTRDRGHRASGSVSNVPTSLTWRPMTVDCNWDVPRNLDSLEDTSGDRMGRGGPGKGSGLRIPFQVVLVYSEAHNPYLPIRRNAEEVQ